MSTTSDHVSNISEPRRLKVSVPILGAGDRIGEGDTYLVENVLPPELAEVAFEELSKEVVWNVMHHRGGEVPRLVAVQGEIDADGNYPIYRHPADESPPLLAFSPTVSAIRAHVERALQHPVNHVLIQLYRTGADYISEHSDKTVDVVRGSRIANLSLGARRTMTLRTKKDALLPLATASAGADADGDHHRGGGDGDNDGSASASASASGHGVRRTTQRIPLPHNSLFVLGLETNARWMHSVHTDKRPEETKDPAERGQRISLTFRHIGTFLTSTAPSGSAPPPSSPPPAAGQDSEQQQFIFGNGATGKTRAEARPVVRGGEEAERLLAAFGAENHQSEFDWEEAYGKGFDVLHFTTSTVVSV